MSSSHVILRYLRLIHLYFGVFLAPAILFFAFTGALQTFSLHETTRGSSYKPPSWAVTLAQIHKKQTPIVAVKKAPAPDKPIDKTGAEKPQAQPTPAPKPADAPPAHNALPLKVFFLLVAIGLFTSTFSGLYMSYRYIRNRKLITATLLAGVIVPILLTIF